MVLDCVCCFHMCWNKDWFDTYKVCDEGFVTLANDVKCKVVGIGISKIKVKMFDGIVKTLGTVRCVPVWKKFDFVRPV